MEKVAVFLDIDGTIIDAMRGLKQISEKTRYAIGELFKNHYVFIASGRNKTLLLKEVLSLPLSGFILTNGAYAEVNGKVVYENLMDPLKVEMLRNYCIQNNYVLIREEQDIIFSLNDDNNSFIKFLENWSMLPEYKEENGENKAYMAMVVCHNEQECLRFAEDLKDSFDIRKHNSYPSFDVGEFNISKGSAILEVLKYLNIPLDRAYSFGDGLNDMEMITMVGHGIAMGNSIQQLKDVASEVCGDVLDDGIYYYLVEKGIIEPK